MNGKIIRMLQDAKLCSIIQEKLPLAFETVGLEIRGNPAVGILRENVIIGMLTVLLGKESVQPADRAMDPDMDCLVDGIPLQIKTVSGGAGIRLKWTANRESAEEFMATYRPASDLLIARIVWAGSGYLRYVPLEVQQEVWRRLQNNYLTYSGGNTRGVNLSPRAATSIDSHSGVAGLRITWKQAGITLDPHERWISYWRE